MIKKHRNRKYNVGGSGVRCAYATRSSSTVHRNRNSFRHFRRHHSDLLFPSQSIGDPTDRSFPALCERPLQMHLSHLRWSWPTSLKIVCDVFWQIGSLRLDRFPDSVDRFYYRPPFLSGSAWCRKSLIHSTMNRVFEMFLASSHRTLRLHLAHRCNVKIRIFRFYSLLFTHHISHIILFDCLVTHR